MSTRSSIAKFNADGSVTSVYCHSDGYIEWNGRKLAENYNTEEAVDALLALGDLSVLYENLAPKPGEKHGFEYGERAEGVTIAYGRDRGEEGCEARTHEGISKWIEMRKNSWCEFFYLFKDGEWLVATDDDNSQLVPLKGVLEEA